MSELATEPINWEAVRMLALTVGVRESARRMGISEEAVKKRCTREGWLATDEAKRVNRLAVAERSGIMVSPQMSPAAILSAELASHNGRSRVAIARTVTRAAEHFETMEPALVIADAGNLKSIAQTADLVHGWKENTAQVKIRLDVLSGAQDVQAVEIEATSEPVVIDSWQEANIDPLDGY